MSTQDSIQKFFRVYIPNVTGDDMVTVKSVSSGRVWRMEITTNEESEMCKRVRSPVQKEVIQVESDEEEEESKQTDEDDDDDERSDDDYMFVEDEESTDGVDESPKREERGGTSKSCSCLKIESDKFEDNNLNPTFTIKRRA